MFFRRTKVKYGFADIGLKTDVHTHILPGVDDGSQNFAVSAEILEKMRLMGVERFIFTPHVSAGIYPNKIQTLVSRFDEFKGWLRDSGDEDWASLHLASEYMVDEFFDRRDSYLQMAGNHVLVEMSYFDRSLNIKEAVFHLTSDGFNPILAHPERYSFYQSQSRRPSGIDELEVLIEMGCELQLNIQSLTGAYGQGSVSLMQYLLDHDMYSYIATDIHSPRQLGLFNGFLVNEKQMEKIRTLAANNDKLF